jgi:hypothetical protein
MPEFSHVSRSADGGAAIGVRGVSAAIALIYRPT